MPTTILVFRSVRNSSCAARLDGQGLEGRVAHEVVRHVRAAGDRDHVPGRGDVPLGPRRGGRPGAAPDAEDRGHGREVGDHVADHHVLDVGVDGGGGGRRAAAAVLVPRRQRHRVRPGPGVGVRRARPGAGRAVAEVPGVGEPRRRVGRARVGRGGLEGDRGRDRPARTARRASGVGATLATATRRAGGRRRPGGPVDRRQGRRVRPAVLVGVRRRQRPDGRRAVAEVPRVGRVRPGEGAAREGDRGPLRGVEVRAGVGGGGAGDPQPLQGEGVCRSRGRRRSPGSAGRRRRPPGRRAAWLSPVAVRTSEATGCPSAVSEARWRQWAMSPTIAVTV